MAYAASQPAFDDAAWAKYVQEPPEPLTLHPTHRANLAPDSSASASSMLAGALDPYVAADLQSVTVEPQDTYVSDPTAAYFDHGYIWPSQRSHSSGTTPSPALPNLSPASSASVSSSFSGLGTPYHYASSSTANEYLREAGSGLLPAADLQDGGLSVAQPAMHKGTLTSFAETQDQYFQRRPQPPQSSHRQRPAESQPHEALYEAPQSPAYTHSRSPPFTAAAPATPRRQATASYLYRSPSAYPAMSSPATSPYHRPTPRSTASFPSGSMSTRRGSTSSINESPCRRATPRKVAAVTETVDASGSPVKSIRRVAKLSIDVPPLSGRSATLAASAPPSSRTQYAMQPVFGSSASGGPTSMSAQQLTDASVREVEQLLGELGPILDTSLLEERNPSDPMRGSVSTSAPRAEGASTFAPASVNLSGVTLTEEDFRLLDEETLSLATGYDAPYHPQSAPAWQTSFDLRPPPPLPSQAHRSRWQPTTQWAPSFSATNSLSHSASVDALAQPFQPHVRAFSAYDSVPPGQDFAYPTSPTVNVLRRRSSCNAIVGAPAPSQLPSWSGVAQRPLYHPTFERVPLPTVLQPVPIPGVERPVTPPPRPDTSLSASTSKPSPLAQKTTPKRKRGSPIKTKPALAMFVNYSAQDAKKLLNGVAPSGSTKKRREEEESHRQRDEPSSFSSSLDSAVPAVPPAPCPPPFATGSHSHAA